MKRRVLLLPVLVAALYGQQTTPVVATSAFYDTDDPAAFVAFSKSTTVKLFEIIFKEDPKIRSATMSVRLFGGNPAPVGRYRLVVIRDGYAEPSPATIATYYQKLGMTQAEYQQQSSKLRKLTGNTLRVRMATTSGDQVTKLVEGDIIAAGLKKILPDRDSDYYAMEREQYLPMHMQMVKDGAMKSWSLWAFRSPAGTDRKHDAVATTVYKDLEAAMAPLTYRATFSKVFPNGNMGALVMRARSVVNTVETNYWRVLWSVSR